MPRPAGTIQLMTLVIPTLRRRPARLARRSRSVPLAEVECPGEPWCAVRLEPGIALYPETAHWLGDFERCLAWAWLERLRVRE